MGDTSALASRSPARAADRPDYRPVADYGLLADCNSAALVDRDGSIDWLCLPRYDSAAVLSLVFVAGASTLTIAVPEVRFTGGTPTVGGPDVVVADVPFEGQYDGTNAGITVTYVTPDATT